MTVWDMRRARRIYSTNISKASDVGWSPDGRFILWGSFTGRIHVLRAEDGKRVLESYFHKGAIMAVAWSPDGRRFVTGGVDGELAIWDAATGMRIVHFPCGSPVWDATWSPDGRRLACVCADGKIRLWGSRELELPSSKATYLQSGVLAAMKTLAEEALEEEARLTAAIKSDPKNLKLWMNRALFYLQHQQWTKAKSDLDRLVRLLPRQLDRRALLALGHLAAGEENKYREQCRMLTELYSDGREVKASPNIPASVCSLFPDAVQDHETVLKMAQQAARANPQRFYYRSHTTAMALYRLKRYGEALQAIKECEQMKDVNAPECRSLQLLWTAMCQHQLKEEQKAKETLKKAVSLIETGLPRPGEKLSGRWEAPRYVECQIIRREAEALILGNTREIPKPPQGKPEKK